MCGKQADGRVTYYDETMMNLLFHVRESLRAVTRCMSDRWGVSQIVVDTQWTHDKTTRTNFYALSAA